MSAVPLGLGPRRLPLLFNASKVLTTILNIPPLSHMVLVLVKSPCVSLRRGGNGRLVKSASPMAHVMLVAELALPQDFIYGSATAAYQIEGGFDQDGKGPSIWDHFSHLEPTRTSGANDDVACDHYNRLDEDIELMSSYGLEADRFSIAWSRIISLGGRHDPVNDKSITFYNRLIDGLVARRIKPVITLHHWDLPLEIQT